MRAINHALTGALIGLTVSEPVIALPAALASHFVLDTIPHHGAAKPSVKALRSQYFKLSLIIDAILCAILVGILASSQPLNWVLAAVCAFVAAAPDLISYRRYRAAQNHKKWRPNPYEKFAHRIQWFERPIGAVVEIAWLVAALALVVPYFS